MKGSVFRKKSIQDLIAATSGEKSLKRELGAFDLTLLGIGCHYWHRDFCSDGNRRSHGRSTG